MRSSRCTLAAIAALIVAGAVCAQTPQVAGGAPAPAPLTVTGRVLDTTGKPVSGAEVFIPTQPFGEYYLPGEAATTRSDAEGRFRFADLPNNGTREIIVARAPGSDLVAVARLNAGPRVLVLKPGWYLSARVADEAGNPLPDVRVVWRWSWQVVAEAKTDAAGVVRLGPLPAAADVTLANHMWSLIAPDFRGKVIGPREQRFELLEGREITPLPIILNPAGRKLSLRVLDANGAPVAGALVGAAGAAACITTDAAGAATLTGLDAQGELTLVAVHPSQPLLAAAPVDLYDTPEVQLKLGPPVTASGVTLDRQGKPMAAEVSVNFRRPLVLPDELLARLWQRGHWEAKSGADGRWTVSNLLPGLDYSAYAGTGTDTANGRADFDTRSGATVTVPDFKLTAR